MSAPELRVSVGRRPLSGQHVKCRQLPGNHLAGISPLLSVIIFNPRPKNTGGLNPENSGMSPTPLLMDSKLFAILEFWKNSFKEHKLGCYLNIIVSNRAQLWESGAQMIRRSVVDRQPLKDP